MPATAMAISTNLSAILCSNPMRETPYSLSDDDDLGHYSECAPSKTRPIVAEATYQSQGRSTT